MQQFRRNGGTERRNGGTERSTVDTMSVLINFLDCLMTGKSFGQKKIRRSNLDVSQVR